MTVGIPPKKPLRTHNGELLMHSFIRLSCLKDNSSDITRHDDLHS